MAQVDEVRRYYDANTAAFERFGQGRGKGAIRRAVWGQGTRSRTEAFDYVDQLIWQRLRSQIAPLERPAHVIDLGCGLGASLIFLAARAPIQATGITLSPLQALNAQQRVQAAGLSDRVACRTGDFLALPHDIATADLAFSIEAFVHVPDARGYFAACSRMLAPGGLLIVCDDFATEQAAATLPRRHARWLDEFRRGWLAPTLFTPRAVQAIAHDFGFIPLEDLDLTPYLELGRPRDRLLGAVLALSRHLPLHSYRWRSLQGGHALQRALRARLIDYRFLVWRRAAGRGT